MVSSTAARYVRLNKEQQQTIRDYVQSSPGTPYKELAAWTAAKLKLPAPPSRSTLNRILQRPTTEAIRPLAKTLRGVTSSQLEERLMKWIDACESWKLPIVTCATIRGKAVKIRDHLLLENTGTPTAALAQMKFSNGWLCKFQRRYNLSSKRICGEAASVDADAVKEGRKKLQKITQAYAKRDVFNLDETAYFYCSHPTRSISNGAIVGRKKSKKRITVAVACNADGSTKLPLLFVGSSRRPRCFQGKSSDELGVQYESTPKAWMTKQLFETWVLRFNELMRDANRSVLLLIDNASSHRVDEPLSHVTLQPLPPNTTAVLQPQDAGIIRQFKVQIQARKTRHVVDWFDDFLAREGDSEHVCAQELDKVYSVDVLVAMRWAIEAWEAVTTTTITNCWRHTEVLDESMYELIDSVQAINMK